MSGMCCKCGVAHVTPEETAEIDRLRAVERAALAVCTDWAGDPDFGAALDPLIAALGDRVAEDWTAEYARGPLRRTSSGARALEEGR